jgi:hypothetical protein
MSSRGPNTHTKETRNLLKGIDRQRKKRTNLSVPNELGKAFLLARKHAAAELEQPKTIFAEGSG